MATSNYQNILTEEVVKVEEIGNLGARCTTRYNSEIIVRWGVGIPSPVPAAGDFWLVEKMASGTWVFSSRIESFDYRTMRYAMTVSARSCVGRERSAIDGVSRSGVSEIYLVVAERGCVYWNSDVAPSCGLGIYGGGVIEQVMSRCKAAGISVTLVVDCELWSDVSNAAHNAFQQMEVSESSIGDASAGRIGGASEVGRNYKRMWSFTPAESPVAAMVGELYALYGGDVRGICFRNWRIDGAFADVSNPVVEAYGKEYGRDLVLDMVSSIGSESWWALRREIASFYARMQSSFVSKVSDAAPGWAVSVIAPMNAVCVGSERAGRYATWIGDDFPTFGWSMVGGALGRFGSADDSAALREFEFDVACLKRLAGGHAPLYCIGIDDFNRHRGVLSVLARYGAGNVLLDGYDGWRALPDGEASSLRDEMNLHSVYPANRDDSVGFYLSYDSMEMHHRSGLDPNRFMRAARDACVAIVGKTPHRLRILHDSDIDGGSLGGISALVVFEASNMSDKAIDSIYGMLGREDRNVVFVGPCGMYDEKMSATGREEIPFVDFFGERGFRMAPFLYSRALHVLPGPVGSFEHIYLLGSGCVGIMPTVHTDIDEGVQALSYRFDDGACGKVVAPFWTKNRSSMIGLDVFGNETLLDLIGELALYAIGRDM